jgi:hypothetical protein
MKMITPELGSSTRTNARSTLEDLAGQKGHELAGRPARRMTPATNLRAQLERFMTELAGGLNWLAGADTHKFNVAEKLFSPNLPPGLKIHEASAEQIGEATKAALEAHCDQAEEIVRFVFSSLKSHDDKKGEVVVRSMISVVNALTVPRFVQIAVRARPSLAPVIARTAAAHLPEKAEQISRAVESVVTSVC